MMWPVGGGFQSTLRTAISFHIGSISVLRGPAARASRSSATLFRFSRDGRSGQPLKWTPVKPLGADTWVPDSKQRWATAPTFPGTSSGYHDSGGNDRRRVATGEASKWNVTVTTS